MVDHLIVEKEGNGGKSRRVKVSEAEVRGRREGKIMRRLVTWSDWTHWVGVATEEVEVTYLALTHVYLPSAHGKLMLLGEKKKKRKKRRI